MDFSVTVILYGLTAIIGTTGMLGGVYWHVSRRSAVAHKAAPLQQAHRIWVDEIAARRSPLAEALETTGRHHIPDELLHVATYKLSADRLARATVPAARAERPVEVQSPSSPGGDPSSHRLHLWRGHETHKDLHHDAGIDAGADRHLGRRTPRAR